MLFYIIHWPLYSIESELNCFNEKPVSVIGNNGNQKKNAYTTQLEYYTQLLCDEYNESDCNCLFSSIGKWRLSWSTFFIDTNNINR